MAIYTRPGGMIRNFESQFEEDGDGGYLYRLRGTGKPVPVTRVERKRFVDQYASRMLLIYAAMMIAALTFFFVFFWRVVRSSKVLPSSVILSDPFFYAGLGVIVLPASVLMYWLRGAPARALKGRAPVGPEITRDEARAIRWRKMSYGQIALIALVGGGSYSYIAHGHWDRRWIFMPPLVVAVAAVQAFRKWRFERTHSDIR